MAAMQKAMCSSMGTPSSSAPLRTSSRLTPRAKALSFSLRFTESGSTSKMLLPGLTSEQRVFERSLARDATIIRVGENRTNHFLGIPALTKDRRAASRVFFSGTVGVVWPAFVIEVVQESGESPEILVRAGIPSIGTHAGFDG